MTLRVEATVADRDVDVALTVRPGETVAVLGPNGAGKSTVLGLVAGLLRPDAGRVTLHDRTLAGDGHWVPPHERRVALLAQDPLLFPHLSVLDNVAFAPRCSGVRRRAARSAAAAWLERLGVETLAGRRTHEISGGQAQRVAIARALAAEPEVLLLDEPMAALDVAVAPALRQTLRGVLADRTAVIVTHDALDALLLADRVVVVDGGRVVEDGPTEEVLSRPRSPFAARIAGLNLVDGTWTGEAVASDGEEVRGFPGGPSPAVGEPAVAVFSPSVVSVFAHDPGGSPRNALPVVVTLLEPLGDRVRVRAETAAAPGGSGSVSHLAADLTPQSVAELDLAPGSRVLFSVKASEVAVYGTASHPAGR